MYSLHLHQTSGAHHKTRTGRCLSSVHQSVIELKKQPPLRKADAKVETFYDSGKYFEMFF